MKSFILCLVAGLTPFLMLHSAFAESTTAPQADKPTTTQKPSLTFYYYDG
ncbi:MAG: hypothetical protein P8O22_08680 [Akkermansiaceae bacterium]|nr:hypothetical protein [Akkermansiaceae bacterium]